MRLEKNAYTDELPIDIKVVDIKKYPPHYHKDLEIILVLQGTLNFRNGPFDYVLKPGDVFTNNRCEIHSMYSNKAPNKVAVIKISGSFFTRYFPNFSKSTYMFYSDKENVPQQEHLRGMLLYLIDKYFKQGRCYKSDCIDQTFRIIQYLNNNFNVFGFGNNQLCKFENTNPITINRIHDIIHYTYDNHNMNITLDDLSELVHLSPYYISHMVRDNIGISFSQFLYFVRVEWSEVNLLNPKKKISKIAKDVGFSNTSYYRTYFRKWFGCSPEEYRSKYLPAIKSNANPEIMVPYTQQDILETINELLSSSDMYDAPSANIKHKRETHTINSNQNAICVVKHDLQVQVTVEDYNVLQNTLISRLNDLHCKNILLCCSSNDNAVESIILHEALQKNGFHVSLSNPISSPSRSYGFDSIASFFYIMEQYLFCDSETVSIPFRDQGSITKLIKGNFALTNSRGTLKSSYFACKMLSFMNGQLLLRSDSCFVLKLNATPLTYAILTYNYDDTIEKLCYSDYTPYEVKATISDFNDDLDIDINLMLPGGKYFIAKYSLDEYNNEFDLVSKLNFPEDIYLPVNLPLTYYSAPRVDVRTKKVQNSIKVNSHFRGVGAELTIVQQL